MPDLDLSDIVQEPVTVALPSGIYEMAHPQEMSLYQYHKIISTHNKVIQKMSMEPDDWTDVDVKEMESYVIDVCCQILPGASRDEITNLGYPRQDKLIAKFFELAPKDEQSVNSGDSDQLGKSLPDASDSMEEAPKTGSTNAQ